MADFSTDDASLAILRQACTCGEDGRSHLFDLLHFGTVEASREQLASNVVEVFYEPGREPWSVQQVIIALCDEIERLREDT